MPDTELKIKLRSDVEESISDIRAVKSQLAALGATDADVKAIVTADPAEAKAAIAAIRTEPPIQVPVSVDADTAPATEALDKASAAAKDAKLDAVGTAKVDADPAVASLAKVGRESQLTKTKIILHGVVRIATAGASAALRQIGDLADKAARKLASIGSTAIKWGGAALAAGAIASSVAVVKLGADMEQTRLSFQTMLGDVKAGNTVLAQLADFANVTPFDTTEVVAAGKTLMAFGVDARDMMGLLKQIGDVSAGTGKPLTELSQIIGKVMAKGKADTEILNQMTEAGIPIIKTLAAQYGVSGAKIYEMAEKGKLTAATVTAAFASMSEEGGMFANMMEKQSQTVGGKWSTVIGKLKLTAATLGEQLSPALQAGLDYLMKWIDRLGELANSGEAMDYLVTLGEKGVDAFGEVIIWLNRFYQYGLLVFRQLRSFTTMAFEGIQYAITGSFVKVIEVASGALNGIVAAVNQARALIGKEPLKVDFDANLDAMRVWRDSSKQMMEDAAKEWAGGNISKALDAEQAVTDTVNAARNKFREGAEKFRATIKDGIKQRAGDAAGLDGIKPEIPQPDPVKIKSVVEKPNLDALTKIGLYNFRIPVVANLAGAANGGVIGAGRSPITAAGSTSPAANAPIVPQIDIERNTILKDILAVLRTPQTTTQYRLA